MNTHPSRLRASTRGLIALALLLSVLLPAAATAAPTASPLASPCAPGAAYDPACDVDHDGDVDVMDVQLSAGHWNQSGTWTGGDYWSLTGNAGTVPGVNVLGTTDPVTLTVVVSGMHALRIEPASDVYLGFSPRLVGGYQGNIVDHVGTTIGGGGSGWLNCGSGQNEPCINQATRNFATVSGGLGNTASGGIATVGGGKGNTASGTYDTVGGGNYNTASGGNATVGGGNGNTASFDSATVGGGTGNTAGHGNATVGGGWLNVAIGPDSTIGGGSSNIASASYAIVGGGFLNTASGSASTVGGGYQNIASGDRATVPGGTAANASHYGELAFASGAFSPEGDAQTSLYVLRRQTTDATATELFLNGSSERITLASNRVLSFDILVAGAETSEGGNSAGYQIAGVIENIGGTTSFVGAPAMTVLGEDVAAWDVQVQADDTNDALVILVQGTVATDIRWVASVRTAEVAY